MQLWRLLHPHSGWRKTIIGVISASPESECGASVASLWAAQGPSGLRHGVLPLQIWWVEWWAHSFDTRPPPLGGPITPIRLGWEAEPTRSHGLESNHDLLSGSGSFYPANFGGGNTGRGSTRQSRCWSGINGRPRPHHMHPVSLRHLNQQ